MFGARNDGNVVKKERPKPPFLSMYKIMPTEGNQAMFMKLQKKAGFVGLNSKMVR